MTATDIPEGFERHTRRSPLTDPWEPLYSRRTDKAVIIGLRLAKAHTNGRGLIHGGLIAALADNAMGHSCAHVMGGVSSLVTIGLAVDFVVSPSMSALADQPICCTARISIPGVGETWWTSSYPSTWPILPGAGMSALSRSHSEEVFSNPNPRRFFCAGLSR